MIGRINLRNNLADKKIASIFYVREAFYRSIIGFLDRKDFFVSVTAL